MRALQEVLRAGLLRGHEQVVVHQPHHHAAGRRAVGPVQAQAPQLQARAEDLCLHVAVVQVAQQRRQHRPLGDACDNVAGTADTIPLDTKTARRQVRPSKARKITNIERVAEGPVRRPQEVVVVVGIVGIVVVGSGRRPPLPGPLELGALDQQRKWRRGWARVRVMFWFRFRFGFGFGLGAERRVKAHRSRRHPARAEQQAVDIQE